MGSGSGRGNLGSWFPTAVEVDVDKDDELDMTKIEKREDCGGGIYNTEDPQTKCAVVRRALCRGVARARMRLADRLRHLDGRRFDARAAMEVPLEELRARVDWHPTMVNAEDMCKPVIKRARLCF